MRIKLTIAAFFALAGSANALTLQEAMNELGGMHCSGSTCTSEQTTTNTRDVLVSPAVSGDEVQYINTDNPYDAGWWNAECKTFAYVNSDCTVQSLNQGTRGNRPAVYGSESYDTCTVTSKELTYNPNSSRDLSWSISTSTSTNEGGC